MGEDAKEVPTWLAQVQATNVTRMADTTKRPGDDQHEAAAKRSRSPRGLAAASESSRGGTQTSQQDEIFQTEPPKGKGKGKHKGKDDLFQTEHPKGKDKGKDKHWRKPRRQD